MNNVDTHVQGLLCGLVRHILPLVKQLSADPDVFDLYK